MLEDVTPCSFLGSRSSLLMTLMILVFLAFVRSHFPPATDVRVMDAESVIGFALLLLISVLLYTWRAA